LFCWLAVKAERVAGCASNLAEQARKAGCTSDRKQPCARRVRAYLRRIHWCPLFVVYRGGPTSEDGVMNQKSMFPLCEPGVDVLEEKRNKDVDVIRVLLVLMLMIVLSAGVAIFPSAPSDTDCLCVVSFDGQ
jgi:hypothetical protein